MLVSNCLCDFILNFFFYYCCVIFFLIVGSSLINRKTHNKDDLCFTNHLSGLSSYKSFSEMKGFMGVLLSLENLYSVNRLHPYLCCFGLTEPWGKKLLLLYFF